VPLPLVSIVTPVLNGARFLPDCLESVRAQSHAPVEHIVVDGGSTDGTLDILRAAPGVRLLQGRDRGLYDALRKGFDAARGEVLAYQNADDRYAHEHAVAWAVEALGAHPEADLVWGDFRWIDELGHERRDRPRRLAPRCQDEIRRWNFVPPHATFLRARLVRDEGLGPDPELTYAGDWEWYLRLHLRGKRFLHLERVLADFRLHGASKTSTVGLLAKAREWRLICRRHGLSFAIVAWNELLWMPLRHRLGG
jgi:glycosyltransferase involved in cell wall biosynthesis